MPIAAHCENGLTLDVFGSFAAWFGCDYYCLESDKVAWAKGNQVKYYDLKSKEMLMEMEMERPREIRMSGSGRAVGILSSRGEMVVLGKGGVKLRAQGVSRFRLSDKLLAYAANGSFLIHGIDGDEVEEEPFHTSRVSMLEFFVSGEHVFLATKRLERDGEHKLLRIGRGPVEVLHSLKELQGFSMKTHVSGGHALVLLMTSYVNDSYFPEVDLYVYDAGKGSFKSVGYSPVHSYVFLSDGFAVCHGAQPSSVSVHGLDGRYKYSFPEGARNRIFFNQHENIVVFAGFDNLSGDIEVFDVASRKLLAKFNVLGASLVDWKEDGSHFYVSTTSYFQEDNGIVVYDYYGRRVDERRFESLVSARGYGETEAFVCLEKPEKPIIEVQQRYVPPSVHSAVARRAGAKPLHKKGAAKRPEPAVQVQVQRPKESIRAELVEALKEVEALKSRMGSGEDLSVKELNMILKESKLRSELKNLKE